MVGVSVGTPVGNVVGAVEGARVGAEVGGVGAPVVGAIDCVGAQEGAKG